jgi:hypothetical protein
MYKVQLFGHDLIGKAMRCDLPPSFATCQSAIEAAETATIKDVNGFRGAPTNYRIIGVGGAILLDVEVHGSQRRYTAVADARTTEPATARPVPI